MTGYIEVSKFVMVDCIELVGLVSTALLLVFGIAPVALHIFFDYEAKTYLEQVYAGLRLILALLVIAFACLVCYASIDFIFYGSEASRALAERLLN